MIKIKFLDKLLSLIYSRICINCNSAEEDSLLCSKCRNKITFRRAAVYKEINGCKIYVCAVYKDAVKNLVKKFKYAGRKDLAEIFAEIMFSYFSRLNLHEKFTVLSVPIHKNRLKERKYNHMDLAAEFFVKASGFSLCKNFLLRVKDTNKQYNLNRTERFENIKGAFELNNECAPDKSAPLLIIDDITSTGATLEEIIKLLKRNGYKNISALALSAPAAEKELPAQKNAIKIMR